MGGLGLKVRGVQWVYWHYRDLWGLYRDYIGNIWVMWGV